MVGKNTVLSMTSNFHVYDILVTHIIINYIKWLPKNS